MLPLPFSRGGIYAAIFWTVYAIWVGSETIASLKKPPVTSSQRRDRGAKRLLIALIWAGISLDFALSFRFPGAAIRGPRAALFYGGICLMLAGFALRWYSISVLGRYFTFDVAIHAGHNVIEAGPYRYIRHPSYTGAILTVIGFGLALENWMGLAALLACIGIGYGYRISVEETALAEALGEEYIAYARRTRRLVPLMF
jgi:protein-S-isoprenylcysteine O-methyltransferase